MGKQFLIKIYSIYHSEVGGIRPTYQSTHPHSLINGLLFIIEIHAAKILEHYFSSNWGWVLRIFTLRIYFKLSIELPKNPLFLLSYIITSLGFLPLLGVPFLWSVRLIKHIMKIKSLKDREKAQYEPKALWLWALQIFSCCISNLSIWTDDIINIK